MATNRTTAVLEVAGVHWASEKATVERVLGRRPGVLEVEANPVGQTATVTYDPTRTSVADLAHRFEDAALSVGTDPLAPDRYLMIDSGGSYALAAARALKEHSSLGAPEIVRRALEIADEICIYTNTNITVLELD